MNRSLAIALVFLVSANGALAATQAQLDQMRAKALAWLVLQQQGDGSWRDGSGNGVQATASAIDALRNSGITTGYVPGAALSWLGNAETPSTDSLARQTAVLARMGISTTEQIARLVDTRDAFNRGWGAYSGYQSSMPDTALGYDALLAANSSNQVTDDQLRIAFTNLQHSDGSWFYLPVAADGAKGSLIPTAYGVLVLSRYAIARGNAGTTTTAASLTNGVNWLLAHKKNDGGYAEDLTATGAHDPAKPGQIYETTLVQTALRAAVQAGFPAAQTTQAAQAMAQIDDFLIARQSTDGSWNGDPIQTAMVAQGQAPTVLADSDHDGVPDAVEPYIGHNTAIADTRDLPKGNGNPTQMAAMETGNDGDAPLPLWSIALLGASLLGAMTRRK